MSQIGEYFVFKSFILITYGATYPGVPHLTNKYDYPVESSESPKSAMTQS